jgi:CHC2 zinc finger
MADLIVHYTNMRTSHDPARRQLAQEQLRRLAGASLSHDENCHTIAPDDRLLSAISATVGPLTERRNGTHDGPCPWHASRSGACLVVWPAEGSWWCSSCKRHGDLVAWVALTEGIAFCAARRKLGIPNPPRQPKARRRPKCRALPTDWRPSGHRLRADWRPGLPLFDDEAQP